jgi:hypothetical protein
VEWAFSPQLLRLFEIAEDQRHQVYFVVLEYLTGGTLKDRRSGKPWNAPESVALLRDVGSALDYAHHREWASSIAISGHQTPRSFTGETLWLSTACESYYEKDGYSPTRTSPLTWDGFRARVEAVLKNALGRLVAMGN